MDLLGGRLPPKPFALGVAAVYIAGIAAQALLVGEVTARAGLWPFIVAQLALIAVWLVLHIRRLRDAGQGPAAAIGVALIYALSIGLLLLLVVFFTHPAAVAPRGGESPASDAALGTLLVVFLFNILFTPDFGVFSTILKILILIAFMPVAISLHFRFAPECESACRDSAFRLWGEHGARRDAHALRRRRAARTGRVARLALCHRAGLWLGGPRTGCVRARCAVASHAARSRGAERVRKPRQRA